MEVAQRLERVSADIRTEVRILPSTLTEPDGIQVQQQHMKISKSEAYAIASQIHSSAKKQAAKANSEAFQAMKKKVMPEAKKAFALIQKLPPILNIKLSNYCEPSLDDIASILVKERIKDTVIVKNHDDIQNDVIVAAIECNTVAEITKKVVGFYAK